MTKTRSSPERKSGPWTCTSSLKRSVDIQDSCVFTVFSYSFMETTVKFSPWLVSLITVTVCTSWLQQLLADTWAWLLSIFFTDSTHYELSFYLRVIDAVLCLEPGSEMSLSVLDRNKSLQLSHWFSFLIVFCLPSNLLLSLMKQKVVLAFSA